MVRSGDSGDSWTKVSLRVWDEASCDWVAVHVS
jgi:hypothetical protein